jgi:Predicted membrane protein (DUF2231)
MPDTINGLPLHPLIVHAVVVLLPLSALGVLALGIRPVWRGTFGWLVVAGSAASVIAIPMATQSGEHLEQQVGDVGAHGDLGDSLIFFALPLLLAALGLTLVHRWKRQRSTMVATVVAVLAIVVAAANLVQVYRVGDSGAKAVWQKKSAATAPR